MVPDSLFCLLLRINHSTESRPGIAGSIEQQRILIFCTEIKQMLRFWPPAQAETNDQNVNPAPTEGI